MSGGNNNYRTVRAIIQHDMIKLHIDNFQKVRYTKTYVMTFYGQCWD